MAVNSKLNIVQGASGSGKSTLLYLLGAPDNPTSDEKIINGTALADMNDNDISKHHRQQVDFTSHWKQKRHSLSFF